MYLTTAVGCTTLRMSSGTHHENLLPATCVYRVCRAARELSQVHVTSVNIRPPSRPSALPPPAPLPPKGPALRAQVRRKPDVARADTAYTGIATGLVDINGCLQPPESPIRTIQSYHMYEH